MQLQFVLIFFDPNPVDSNDISNLSDLRTVLQFLRIENTRDCFEGVSWLLPCAEVSVIYYLECANVLVLILVLLVVGQRRIENDSVDVHLVQAAFQLEEWRVEHFAFRLDNLFLRGSYGFYLGGDH